MRKKIIGEIQIMLQDMAEFDLITGTEMINYGN